MSGAATTRIQERQPSEADLLGRFVAGDRDAFETLFRAHQAEVFAWIVRIVRDTGAAEDLTLETFWRIYRARNRFDSQRSFGAWARRIACNLALDHLKTLRPEAALAENLSPVIESDPGVRQEVRSKTAWAFQQLPAKLQVVAGLALIEEQPYQEIADALGVSMGTVKSRVFRAVRLLRKQLKEMGIQP
jgi:RNA polymerase sigma-70 factor (ECF subfamily)